jgi:16S rRNA (guanine966-N2)-methyltransferase
MRIIAGLAKGTNLLTPKSGTRPMTGRARESLFSILAARLTEVRVLDLYAGSGSLGLEALSRGAASATFVERDRKAAALIAKNIESVGLGGDVVAATVESAIERIDGPFDLVFIDPPYADDDVSVTAVLDGLEPLVAQDGIVVVHRQARSDFDVPEFLTSTDQRRYGDAVVTIMKRTEP